MSDVSYCAPTDIGEALKILAEGKTTVLAGGTDLLPKINYHEFRPEALLYIGRLGLDYIKEEGGKLLIGAATSTAKLAASELVAAKAPALAEAAKQSGSVAIRTTATVGGNIANGSPAADLVAPLLAMDAAVCLARAGGERVVPLGGFFLGPQQTARRLEELITEIQIPIPKGKTVFLKVGRRHAQTLSVANVALRLFVDEAVCKEARIVLGAMAPTPLRCAKAEELIVGKALDEALIEQCAAAAVAESAPIDDQRATAWYRQRAAKALVARALKQAAGI
jgi:CO/xanthine dehydrogenase FAD-binding subunit